MPQPEQHSFAEKNENNFAILVTVINTVSLIPLMFTRIGFGVNGLGMEAFFCMILIPLMASAYKDPLILEFWYAWVVMAIWARLTVDRDELRHFQGRVRFWGQLLGWKAATVMEAVSVFVISQLLYRVSTGLGHMMFWGAVATSIRCYLGIAMHNAEVLVLGDAQKEAERMEMLMQEAQELNRRRR